MVHKKLALPDPCLCLVTDRRRLEKRSLAESVAMAVAGGVRMVQLREKDLSQESLLPLARELRAAVGDDALFIVNGSIEVATAAGAHGVHLAEEAMPVREARRLVGSHLLIGRSVHSVERAVKAQDDGADYLIVGTVFETASKPGQTPEGLALLRAVAKEVDIPFLGIGGIDASNVSRVMEAGAGGAAAISALLVPPDPEASARGMARTMARAAEVRASG